MLTKIVHSIKNFNIKIETHSDRETFPLENTVLNIDSKFKVEIKKLCKTYGYKNVLNDLSFNINPGEVTALLGHNGAGKTTVMSIITGSVEVL